MATSLSRDISALKDSVIAYGRLDSTRVSIRLVVYSQRNYEMVTPKLHALLSVSLRCNRLCMYIAGERSGSESPHTAIARSFSAIQLLDSQENVAGTNRTLSSSSCFLCRRRISTKIDIVSERDFSTPRAASIIDSGF